MGNGNVNVNGNGGGKISDFLNDAKPYILLTIGTFAAACYGLVSKKLNYSPLMIVYFFAVTYTIIPLICLIFSRCSLMQVFTNIFNKSYFFLSFILFFLIYGITYSHKILPMSIIGPMLGTLPMFYSFWEYILNGLTINIMQFVGYVIAAIGVLIVNFTAFSRDIKKRNNKFIYGILGVLVFCFGVSYFTLSNVNLKKTTKTDVDFVLQRLFGAGIYIFIILSVLMAVRAVGKCGDKWPRFKDMLKLIGGIAFTSLFSTSMFFATKPDIDPVIFAAHGNIRPVFVVMVGVLVMKEKIDRYILLGLAIIISGIMISIFFTKYDDKVRKITNKRRD